MERNAVTGRTDVSARHGVDLDARDQVDAAGTDRPGTDHEVTDLAPSPAIPVRAETVSVRVQLRPRRSAARRCLAVLTELGAQHAQVGFALEGISSDDRVVRLTLAVDLGPRSEVARFGSEAQAAYAFVNALFVSLYDHMPVYCPESSEAEKLAARAVLALEDTAPSATDGAAAVRDHLGAPAASLLPAAHAVA